MALRAVIDHPKFAALKMRLGLTKGAALGYLEAVWHFCGRFTPHGDIGKYCDKEIESWVEWDGEPGALIAALVECRWLDRDSQYRLLVHDWAKHADNATKLAVTRSKLPFVAPSSPLSVHSVSTVSPQCSDYQGQGQGQGQESGAVPRDAHNAGDGWPCSGEELWEIFQTVQAFANGMPGPQTESLGEVAKRFGHLGRDKLLAEARRCVGFYAPKPTWGGKDTTKCDSAPLRFENWLKGEVERGKAKAGGDYLDDIPEAG